MPQVHLAFDLSAVLRWVLEQPTGKLAPRLELVCAEHPTPERGVAGLEVIQLPGCVAGAPLHGLMELLVAGAQSMDVRLDRCADLQAAQGHLETLVQLFATTGFDRFKLVIDRPAKNRRRQVQAATAMPVSRRRLLTLGLGSSAGQYEQVAQNTARDHGGHRPLSSASDLFDRHPDQSDSDPQRLITALQRLLGTDPATLAAIKEHTASVSLAKKFTASGCTACNVCVRVCPSDALGLTHLTVSDQLSVSTLSQVPASCDGCLECVQACPQDVLHLAGDWDWASVLIPPPTGKQFSAPVTSLTTAQCQRCRTRFPSKTGSALCQVCSYRRKNPFSSTMPPDFRRDPKAAR